MRAILPTDRHGVRRRGAASWGWDATPASAPVLRRQRDLPLPRPCLRRAAVRPRRGARRRLAADCLRRARLRAVAPPLAHLARPPARRPDPAPPVGRGPGADELLLLRRDRPPAAGHGRRD